MQPTKSILETPNTYKTHNITTSKAIKKAPIIGYKIEIASISPSSLDGVFIASSIGETLADDSDVVSDDVVIDVLPDETEIVVKFVVDTDECVDDELYLELDVNNVVDTEIVVTVTDFSLSADLFIKSLFRRTVNTASHLQTSIKLKLQSDLL